MTSEQSEQPRRDQRRTQQQEKRGMSTQSAQHVPETNARGRLTQEQRLANSLGWFGIGLGLAEVLAPRRVAAMVGVSQEHRTLIRMMGLRELASSAGILNDRSSAGAVWSRVAGDVLDLVLLGAAFTSGRSNRTRLAAATASVAGAMVMDVITAQQLSRGIETRGGMIRISAALIIDRAQEPLYRHWRELSNLPQFMKHVMRIEMSDDRRSHWVAKGPVGSTIEWDAELTEDRPNELIAWHSVDGSELDHAGSVRFEQAPGGRGTIVAVEMQYRPPLGTVGAAVAPWFGEDPNQTVKMDLRRFKQIMETGEVITTQGQPAGREESTSWKYDHAVRQ
ncbi:MAG: SRPBCC family protein [Nitrospira sp.]|nr:SRPBCC family protein [Nitrospira sp.]